MSWLIEDLLSIQLYNILLQNMHWVNYMNQTLCHKTLYMSVNEIHGQFLSHFLTFFLSVWLENESHFI